MSQITFYDRREVDLVTYLTTDSSYVAIGNYDITRKQSVNEHRKWWLSQSRFSVTLTTIMDQRPQNKQMPVINYEVPD